MSLMKMMKWILSIMVCLVLEVVSGNEEIRCIPKERQALLQFKSSLVDDYGMLSSWNNTNVDCCQWKGIRCNNLTAHVFSLDLHGDDDNELFFLSGDMDKSLMELQQLQYLNLSYNHFQGSHIPHFFASLTNLTFLDLSDCYFGGNIPTQLGSLSHLKYLNLARNHLEGSIPYQLGNLSNLQYLDLSANSLEGKIPSQLGNLSNLQYLDLNANLLEGKIPSQLGKLSNLQTLSLGGDLRIDDGNHMRGQWLSNLTSLTHLYLESISDFHTSHSYLQIITKLPKLRELSLRYCSLSDHFILSLRPFKFNLSTSLYVLDLTENTFTSSMILEWVSNITSNLVQLDLSGNYLEGGSTSNHFATKMVTLPKLRELSLSNCDLSDNFLHSMTPSQFNFSTSLSVLDLSRNNFISSEIFQWVSNMSSNLVELDLSGNLLLGSTSADHFGIMMNSLERLDLSSNILSGGVLNSFLNICTLHSLYMSGNDLSEDLPTIFHDLSRGCVRNSLLVLDLSNNLIIGSLTDLSMFSSLKTLDLSTNYLSGKVPEGSKLPPRLESLSIQSNSLEGGVPLSFGNACNLETLDLSNNNFNDELPMIIHNLSGCASYSLQKLNLGRNKINGTLPNLSIFSTMKTLDLSENRLNGKISESIKLPPQLKSLSVQSNTLEGGIPKSFGNACNLFSLDMSNNCLNEELPMIIHHLSGCATYSLQQLSLGMNHIRGTLPNLSIFTSLRYLYLDQNRLNETIPDDLQFPIHLENLDVTSNSLKGVITDHHFANMSKLRILSLSNNSLTLAFTETWIPPFQLQKLSLGFCKLGPTFPKWLRTQNSIEFLDISYCGISGIVPKWFWTNLVLPQVQMIDMSYNNLTGTIPNVPQKNTYVSLNLASNQFEGSIPPFLRGFMVLNLSKNKFKNSQPFLCAKGTAEGLGELDLSNNQLFGQIPNCWSHFKSLAYLDLSHNNFSGKIPTSIGSLPELQALILRGNKFTNEIPFSLRNCSKLVMLDVGQNRLTGSIPFWIGSRFQDLQILSLQKNNFSGSLPLQLCYLQSINLLDLSFNHLSGQIPKCIYNLTSMAQKNPPTDRYYASHEYSVNTTAGRASYVTYGLNALLTWKGVEEMFKDSIIYFLKSIDLSSNQFSGEIPTGLENLFELVSLNLSRNNLTGKIPSNIGRLTSLEFLDLSRNQLSGSISSSLTHIDRLTMLDLSYNHLSGEIPISTQLQSFDASSYKNNLDLCGKPLDKLCHEEKSQHNPNSSLNNEYLSFSHEFYISMIFGFIIGFWGSFGSLLIKRSWRHAYFKLLNKLTDNIYVMVARTFVKLNKG